MSKKKISIIIPFYGQTVEQLALPLGSINGQIGIDFSEIDVHLVNDGGEKIDRSAFDIFQNLDIKMHDLKENAGPGIARQYGIDHSDGRYIMFVDADDLLGGPGVVLGFLNVLNPQVDLIYSDYVEEVKHGDKYSYISHDSNTSMGAVYAKLFKRSLLVENDIKFHPDLPFFEDQYFTTIASTYSKNRVDIHQPSYIWRYSPGSLFRSSLSKNESRTDIYAKSLRYQLDFFSKKGFTDLKVFTLNSLLKIYMHQKIDGTLGNAQVYKETKKIAKYLAPLNEQMIYAMVEQMIEKNTQYKSLSQNEVKAYFEKIL